MKPRLISMLLTGLVLALGLLLAVQISQRIRAPNDSVVTDQAGVIEEPDLNKTIDPVIFKTMSEQDGELRLSGTSEPNVLITIEDRGRRLSEIRSDDNGQWSAAFKVEPTNNLVIDLVAHIDDGARVRSDEKLFRITAPNDQTSEDGMLPQALLMITAPGGPTRLIQSPFRGLPTDQGLSLGPIDYDESGGVIFSGASEQAGRVRIYANDVRVGERGVATNGRWFFIATDTLPRGSYDIRIDLVDGELVIASVNVQFERMDPPENSAEQLHVSYQPFVWQIRRKLLGGGYQYTAILAPLESDPIVVEP